MESASTKRIKTTEEEPPGEYICPITHEIMRDPVVASDGNTYERKAIVKWMENQSVSPFTREKFSSKQLYTNRILSNMIKASKFYVPIPEPISKRTRDSEYVLKNGGVGAVIAIHADRSFVYGNFMIKFDGLNVILKDRFGKLKDEIFEFIPSKDAFIHTNSNEKEQYWDLVYVDDMYTSTLRWIYLYVQFVDALNDQPDSKEDRVAINALKKLVFQKLKLDKKKFKI